MLSTFETSLHLLCCLTYKVSASANPHFYVTTSAGSQQRSISQGLLTLFQNVLRVLVLQFPGCRHSALQVRVLARDS